MLRGDEHDARYLGGLLCRIEADCVLARAARVPDAHAPDALVQAPDALVQALVPQLPGHASACAPAGVHEFVRGYHSLLGQGFGPVWVGCPHFPPGGCLELWEWRLSEDVN